MQLTASDPTSAAFRDRVDAEIDAYLTRLTGRLEPVSPALTQLTRVLSLRRDQYRIEVPEEIRVPAKRAIDRMLAIRG